MQNKLQEMSLSLVNSILSSTGLELLNKKKFAAQVPVEATGQEKALINLCGEFSMTGPIRMWSVVQAIKHIHSKNIDGEFVECGVWRGGNLALMSKMAASLEMNRPITGFDTFEGMPEPEDIDLDYNGASAKLALKRARKNESERNIHAFASQAQVVQNLQSLDVTNVKLIKGKVEETLLDADNLPDKIALLRLDTDWYASTKVELEKLYPRLVSGGILIIDDYGYFQGARKAVDEYFGNQLPWLHYVDFTCRLLIKP